MKELNPDVRDKNDPQHVAAARELRVRSDLLRVRSDFLRVRSDLLRVRSDLLRVRRMGPTALFCPINRADLRPPVPWQLFGRRTCAHGTSVNMEKMLRLCGSRFM